jgi:hypothetical protein
MVVNEQELAPPEYMVSRPSQHNGYRWTWMVCQPDCVWAELAYGEGDSEKDAIAAASKARDRIVWSRKHGLR